MRILALEASTSSAKAIVYDSVKGVLSITQDQYPPAVCDVMTQDPEGIYQTLVAVGKRAVEDAGGEIDLCALCSIWPSFVLLDKNYDPVGRILTWADTRCSPTTEKYRRENPGLAQEFYSRTGCTIHSIYGVWQYIHMLETEPELARQGAFFSSQAGFLAHRLTGKPVISNNSASASGMMNIHTLQWDEETAKFCGLKMDQFQELIEPDTLVPLADDVARDLGLPSGIRLAIGGADGGLNQIGSGATKNGVMTFSVGTSAAIRLPYPRPVIAEKAETWCYYMGGGIRLAGAATSGAGNCVEWFKKRLLGNRFSYAELEAAMEDINKNDAPIFLPFLYGERCPGWQDKRQGGYVNMTGAHHLGYQYYSLLEGILMNLYHCYTFLCANAQKPDKIIITGGIEKSEPWLQMAADIFGRDLYIGKEPHASTMGAVACGLKAAGEIKTYEDFPSEVGRCIHPNPDMSKLYAYRFERYLEAYRMISSADD